MKLKPEQGVTQISLENATEIIADRGLPNLIQLVNEGDNTSEHSVIVAWGDFEHKFTGFSWGYGGEGPRGLAKFFQMVGLHRRIPTSIIGKLPSTHPGLLLALARDGWLVEFAYEGADKLDGVFETIEGPVKTPEST
jgi:hypothetical protein